MTSARILAVVAFCIIIYNAGLEAKGDTTPPLPCYAQSAMCEDVGMPPHFPVAHGPEREQLAQSSPMAPAVETNSKEIAAYYGVPSGW